MKVYEYLNFFIEYSLHVIGYEYGANDCICVLLAAFWH